MSGAKVAPVPRLGPSAGAVHALDPGKPTEIAHWNWIVQEGKIMSAKFRTHKFFNPVDETVVNKSVNHYL